MSSLSRIAPTTLSNFTPIWPAADTHFALICTLHCDVTPSPPLLSKSHALYAFRKTARTCLEEYAISGISFDFHSWHLKYPWKILEIVCELGKKKRNLILFIDAAKFDGKIFPEFFLCTNILISSPLNNYFHVYNVISSKRVCERSTETVIL